MLVFKYALFALISTILNLLFQYSSLLVYDGLFSLYIAMFIGTIIGLVAKYILDNKYIFYYASKQKSDDAKTFILYSFVGVFTTIIFWGTEIIFDSLSDNPNAKYIGAIIGLSIGYFVKYSLDKKYVFIHQENFSS